MSEARGRGGKHSPIALVVVLTVLIVGVAACSAGVVAQNGSATDTTNSSDLGSNNTTDIPESGSDDSAVPFPSNPSNVSMVAYVTTRLSDGGDTGRPTADFSGGTRIPTVRSISFATEPVDTVVRIAEYNRLPPTLGSPDAEVVSAMEILVPPSLTQANATLTGNVDRKAIPDQRSPDDLVVLRRVDDEWRPLPTSVVESTDDEVVIEAETSGFSYFAVVADDGTVDAETIEGVVGSTNESTADNESRSDSDPLSEETPTLGIGGVVGTLVLTSLLLARRARSDDRDT